MARKPNADGTPAAVHSIPVISYALRNLHAQHPQVLLLSLTLGRGPALGKGSATRHPLAASLASRSIHTICVDCLLFLPSLVFRVLLNR